MEFSAVQITENYRAAIRLIWDAKLEITRECGSPMNDAGFSKLCHASQYIEKQQAALLADPEIK